MDVNNKKYLNRPIKKDEEELLDKIWNSITRIDDDEDTQNRNYQKMRELMHKKKVRRRIYIASGSVAAIIALLIVLLRPTPYVLETPITTQLSNMGVTILDEQVRLIIDNSSTINLGDAAKINVDNNEQVALLSTDGKNIQLKPEEILKIYVPAGKQFNIELSDGTQVWLNADTWFEYPSTFDSLQERRVKIGGEVFFEVQHDTDRPFFVEMQNGEEIRVLGTSFNVSAYDENEEIVTTLLDGKIAYHTPISDKTINLLPNEQVSINKRTNQIKKYDVNASTFAMWKEGIIYFNNEKLNVLTKRLARTYGIEIDVSDAYKDQCFSGMIKHERGIDYITNLLTTISDIKCTVEEGIIYLK